MTGFKHARPIGIRVSGSTINCGLAVRWIWVGLNRRKSTGQPDSQAFISSSEQGLSSQYQRCTLMPCLMPILEEKWYQQSACWNSAGSWQEAYPSIALWSCKSPFHGRLSISIMHQWWDMEEKFWDCLATGLFSDNKGSPRITALVGLPSNPLMTEARLCRSWTGCWEARNSEPGLNFKGL